MFWAMTKRGSNITRACIRTTRRTRDVRSTNSGRSGITARYSEVDFLFTSYNIRNHIILRIGEICSRQTLQSELFQGSHQLEAHWPTSRVGKSGASSVRHRDSWWAQLDTGGSFLSSSFHGAGWRTYSWCRWPFASATAWGTSATTCRAAAGGSRELPVRLSSRTRSFRSGVKFVLLKSLVGLMTH